MCCIHNPSFFETVDHVETCNTGIYALLAHLVWYFPPQPSWNLSPSKGVSWIQQSTHCSLEKVFYTVINATSSLT